MVGYWGQSTLVPVTHTPRLPHLRWVLTLNIFKPLLVGSDRAALHELLPFSHTDPATGGFSGATGC